jgi:hypothetical protein
MLDEKIQGVFEAFIRGWSRLIALTAILIVIPFTLWFAWRRASALAHPIAVTLFCITLAWTAVSMLRMQRGLHKLGLSGTERMRIFSGPRPDDPDELYAWKWAWRFLCGIIAVGLCMIVIVIAS